MSTNPTFKPSEGKRAEFRSYLEKNGVMDALTKVLVNLYEEPDKPEDALEYIRDRLATQAGIETFGQMKEKIDTFQAKIDSLTLELENFKSAAAPPAEEQEKADVEETKEDVPEEASLPEAPVEEAPSGEKEEAKENAE